MGGFYIYSHQNKILDIVVKELNKALKAEIKVASYELDLFSQFPEVAIHFNDISCLEVTPQPKQNLFVFRSLYVNLNFWDVVQENYDIKKLLLKNGAVNIKLFKDGSNNFTFWKTSNDTSSTKIALSEVQFMNTKFDFYEEESDLLIQTQIDHLQLDGEFWKEEFKANIALTALDFNLAVDRDWLIEDSRIAIETAFLTNPEHTSVSNGILQLNRLDFKVDGDITTAENKWHITGQDLDLSRLIDAIPISFLPLKNEMKTSGNAQLETRLVSNQKGVDIVTIVKLEDGTYSSSKSPVDLENIGFTATYKNGHRNSLASSTLHLENLKGKTKTGSFFCDVDIKNFKQPSIFINGDLALNLEELMKISNPGIFEKVQGEVTSSFTASNQYKSFGEIQTLALADAQFSGKLALKNGFLKFTESNFQLEDIHASMALNGKDITLKELQLNSGETKINADGIFKNALYFGDHHSTPRLELNISSEQINVKEISSWQFGNKESGESALPFDFVSNLNIQKFYWDDFNGYNLTGRVIGNNETIQGSNIKFSSSNGQIDGDFKINTKSNTLYSTAQFTNLDIQNLFKEFQNFGQTDLTNQNIKGNLSADINLQTSFTPSWAFQPQTLNIECKVVLENGQLINYKPLESLEDYAEKEDLQNVTFSTLENNIKIKDSKIYIPQMHIESNALNLDVEGIHYFNSRIDYSIRLQISKVLNGSKTNKTGGYDDFIIVEDRPDQPFIWVNVGCTVSDPCTSLDGSKMKQEVKSGIREQGKEIRNLFKKDSIKAKPTEPEYIFEWEGEEPDTNDID